MSEDDRPSEPRDVFPGAGGMARGMVSGDGHGVLVFAPPEGRLIVANDDSLRMFGYAREESDRGMDTWRTLPPPDSVAVGAAQLAGVAASGWPGACETQSIRKGGSPPTRPIATR